MVNSSASHPHGYTLSDTHRESGPAVADADGAAMEGAVSGEARPMASVASRRTDRSRARAIGRASGDDAFAYGAAAAVNDNVDPSLQWRAAGAEEDLGQREKPAISKGQRAFSRRPFGLVLLYRRSSIDMLAGRPLQMVSAGDCRKS